MPYPNHRRSRGAALGLFVLSIWLVAGCSIKRMAIDGLADALGGTGDVFASDEDPELIREATPFALKTIESLLAEVPDHRGLLLQACQGFTQYAYAFVETDAELIENEDYRAAEALRERALKLYLRGRDYCLRGVEIEHSGVTEALLVAPDQAAGEFEAGDIDWLYWTGASWGAAISLGKTRPELVADLPAVSALLKRALQLDESYGQGALHEALISVESLPANMGGSTERAREHFERAVALSEGKLSSPYVTLALGVAVPAQDRSEFEALLEAALSIDPDGAPSWRLQNLITQKRARYLLEQADDWFLTDEIGNEGDS